MKAPCIGMQGKMLPSVTSEYNGDVLTVVDGEWSKASGGGGDEDLIIHDNNGTLDATWNEIYQEVVVNNKTAFVVVHDGSLDEGYYSCGRYIVDMVSFNDPYYSISVGAGTSQYSCENKDGYPSTN